MKSTKGRFNPMAVIETKIGVNTKDIAKHESDFYEITEEEYEAILERENQQNNILENE